MKGIVFTEFQELVEAKFGLEVYDKLVSSSCPFSGGAYTSVGTYDYKELIQLVSKLSEETGIEFGGLVKAFGQHLFGRLADSFPQFVEGAQSAIELISQIEDHIHVEVKKLYPDAELPKFDFQTLDENKWSLEYNSSRPFADLAEGLIDGAIAFYGDDIEYGREDNANAEPGTSATFLLTQKDPVPA